MDLPLQTLIEQDLGPFLRRSGRWLLWSCPFHEDNTPSLSVTPENDRWYCFSCRRGGGVGAWMRLFRQGQGMLSGARLPAPAQPARDSHPSRAASLTANLFIDYETWQTRAALCIAAWEDLLWSRSGKRFRWYLYSRGLNGEVLQRFHIGCNPHDRWEEAESWGLPVSPTASQRIFLPAGISLPWLDPPEILKVNFRRLPELGKGKPPPRPKYLALRGSRSGGLFLAETLANQPVAILTEGEFDALLLHQHASDLAAVCTLGSASNRRLEDRWIGRFLGCQRIYALGDRDPAGQEYAQALAALSARVRPLAVPLGKDVTEFWQQGGDLRAWVQGLVFD